MKLSEVCISHFPTSKSDGGGLEKATVPRRERFLLLPFIDIGYIHVLFVKNMAQQLSSNRGGDVF